LKSLNQTPSRRLWGVWGVLAAIGGGKYSKNQYFCSVELSFMYKTRKEKKILSVDEPRTETEAYKEGVKLGDCLLHE
jgi:hypothetical protein